MVTTKCILRLVHLCLWYQIVFTSGLSITAAMLLKRLRRHTQMLMDATIVVRIVIRARLSAHFLFKLGNIVAYYRNKSDLHHSPELDSRSYSPGTKVPHSGIYKCLGCNRESACNQGDQLPPQNNHQHNDSQGTIRWQLIVATE